MKLPIMLALLLCSAAVADAENIYKWTNAQGVVSYTDDLARIPSMYRRTALKAKGLPTLTRQQEENALSEELTTPWQVTTSASGQSSAPRQQQAPPLLVGERKKIQ